MSSSRWALPALILATAIGPSCGGRTGPVERFAIVSLDNQSGDPASDWMGHGIAQVAVLRLSSAPAIAAFAAGDIEDARRLRAHRVVQGYWARRGSKIEALAHIRTMDGKTIGRHSLGGASAVEVAGALAKLLWPDAPTVPSPSEEALQLYVEGLRDRKKEKIEESARIEPGFAAAWVALGQLKAAGGDRAGALDAFRRGLAGVDQADTPGRLRIELGAAALTGDGNARSAVLVKLAHISPAHADIAAQAGGSLSAQGRFAEAVPLYETAAKADPGAAAVWNEMAYAQALSGDQSGALASVKKYQEAAPRDANALDSLGEIHLMFGAFAEAEKALLDAYTQDPSLLRAVTLRKAAEARRLSGDAAGAEALFERYSDAIARQNSVELVRAQWSYGSGRRDEAMAAMEKIAQASGLPLAWSQLAVWQVAAGKDGSVAAARAREMAKSPGDAVTAAFVVVVAQPQTTPEEWRQRVESAVPPVLRDRLLAYALLLHKHWAAVVPVLERIAGTSGPVEATRWRNLLGWALLESGDVAKAREALRLWPVPASADAGVFDWMLFPGAREWRARL